MGRNQMAMEEEIEVCRGIPMRLPNTIEYQVPRGWTWATRGDAVLVRSAGRGGAERTGRDTSIRRVPRSRADEQTKTTLLGQTTTHDSTQKALYRTTTEEPIHTHKERLCKTFQNTWSSLRLTWSCWIKLLKSTQTEQTQFLWKIGVLKTNL